MASFALSATTSVARKHVWTNYIYSTCLVYNLVGAFLGLATMLRGENLCASVNSQCAEKSIKMCRTCVGCVGMCSRG